MTLPSSGPLAISQMRDEYALSNPVAMSHFYGKNGLPSSGALSFGGFYGKSNYLDQQIVTVAGWKEFGIQNYGFATGKGSISDGTSNLYSGITITKLHHETFGLDAFIFFTVSSNVTNSGWTSMVINGTTYLRSSANFSSSKEWRWSIPYTTYPFGTTTGAQITVTWY